MVDTLASGASGRKAVEVQVLSWAPLQQHIMMQTRTPTSLKVRRQSQVLELHYDNGDVFQLPFELLRVLSPSAEVRGHSPEQATLQYGKADVMISAIEPAGNYALHITFDDGHDSGIYSWDYLYDLASHRDEYWQDYLQQLQAAGKSRYPDAVQVFDPAKKR